MFWNIMKKTVKDSAYAVGVTYAAYTLNHFTDQAEKKIVDYLSDVNKKNTKQDPPNDSDQPRMK